MIGFVSIKAVLTAMAAGAVFMFFSACGAEETGEYLHYRLGMKYKAEKQFDKAIDEFRKVIVDYPDNYNVYMHIAEIRAEQGQPRQEIANLTQALAYNPGWGKAHRMLAEAYLADSKPLNAISEYQQYQQVCEPSVRDSIQQVLDRLIAEAGSSGRPLQTAGASGMISNKAAVSLPAALSKTPTVQPIGPKAAEAYKQAINLYNDRLYDSSLTLFRRTIALEPCFKGAYYFAGAVRFYKRQYDLARINFTKAGDFVEPGYVSFLCQGKMCGEEKNYNGAIRWLSRYVAVSVSEPGKKEAQQLLAQYKALLNRPAPQKDTVAAAAAVGNNHKESAVEPFMLEVRIDSLLYMVTVDTLSDPGQKLIAGIRSFQAGNYDKAVLEFKKTSAAYPTGPVAVQSMYDRGICYFKLRLFREAENQFQQVIDRFPHDILAGQSCFLKALIHAEQNEPAVAEALYREFIQKWRGHLWEGKAWEKLGDAYSAMEQLKKAADAYSQAATFTNAYSDQVSAFFKMGTTYAALGNGVRSVACFDSAIAKGERNNVYVRVPDSYYRCADEKYRAKDYKAALACYTGVLEKYPAYQETPWGLFQSGNCQKNLGRFTEAIVAYKGLIKRFPEDYWAKQAQWKVDDANWEHDYQTSLH